MPKIFFRKNILSRFLGKEKVDELEEKYKEVKKHKHKRSNWDKEVGRKKPTGRKLQKPIKVVSKKVEIMSNKKNTNMKITLKNGIIIETNTTKEVVEIIKGIKEPTSYKKLTRVSLKAQKVCRICGEVLPSNKSVYCSSKCRKEGTYRNAKRYYKKNRIAINAKRRVVFKKRGKLLQQPF